MRIPARASSALTVTTLAVGAVVFTGQPAQATQLCGPSFIKSFDTPGENIDVDYRFCIEKLNGRYSSKGHGVVADGGGLRKVDSFKVESRLEKANSVVVKKTCDFTNAINNGDPVNINCETAWYDPNASYTADGRIYVDIDLDGKGGTWYNLTGSPALS